VPACPSGKGKPLGSEQGKGDGKLTVRSTQQRKEVEHLG
jgi:hypothetical protein